MIASPRADWDPQITVVSTGNAHPSRARCIESVAAQTGVRLEHRYVDAADQNPPRSQVENFLEGVRGLPADRVVAYLDGDDWLIDDHVLARIVDLHARGGAWVTYGNYIRLDAPCGGCSEYAKTANVRKDVWRASHLRTFRAGLAQRIRTADLMWPPVFCELFVRYAVDLAIMFPILEMAGLDRCVFVSDPLVVYNAENCTRFYADRGAVAEAAAIEKHLRSLPPYERIDAL